MVGGVAEGVRRNNRIRDLRRDWHITNDPPDSRSVTGRTCRSSTARQPAETPNYPRGSTDNELLMNGARVLTEYGAPQATALYIAIVVRCGGKGYCWPSTPVLMADTGARERTINRWRVNVKDAGLITVQRRRNRSALIRLTELSGLSLTLVKPEPEPSTTESSTRLTGRGYAPHLDGRRGKSDRWTTIASTSAKIMHITVGR